jgi:hypothetical protein
VTRPVLKLLLPFRTIPIRYQNHHGDIKPFGPLLTLAETTLKPKLLAFWSNERQASDP